MTIRRTIIDKALDEKREFSAAPIEVHLCGDYRGYHFRNVPPTRASLRSVLVGVYTSAVTTADFLSDVELALRELKQLREINA